MPHWQTILALGIVLVTLLLFLARLRRPKTPGRCGHGCGCDHRQKSGQSPRD